MEALLAERPVLERLACGLVRDSSLADDLAQEACLAAAVRGGPRTGASLRAFLAGVLRNLRRNQVRSDRRRELREAAAARPEALPSSAELVERAELQRLLVESVLALAEPERTAILLRYFEDLTAEEIALRAGVPSATVRSRVQRGLERVRARLESRIPRRDLFAGLVGLARWPAPLAAAATTGSALPWIGGILAMKTFAVLVAACAVLAILVTIGWFLEEPNGRLELSEKLKLEPGTLEWNLRLRPGRIEGSGALGRGSRERYYTYEWGGTESGHALQATLRILPGLDGRFVLPTAPPGPARIRRKDPPVDDRQEFGGWETGGRVRGRARRGAGARAAGILSAAASIASFERSHDVYPSRALPSI